MLKITQAIYSIVANHALGSELLLVITHKRIILLFMTIDTCMEVN